MRETNLLIFAYFPEQWGLVIVGVALATVLVIAGGWGITWLVSRRLRDDDADDPRP